MNKRYSTFILVPLLTFYLVFPMYSQDSLNLSQAIQKTLENNYGIIISRGDVQIASITNNWGNAGRYPTVAFDMSSFNNYEINNTANSAVNRVSTGVEMQWILFNGFRVRITKEQLTQLEDLAKGNSEVIIESSIEDLILEYYNVLLQKEKLEVLEKVMKLSNDRYEYEMKRKELGGSVTYNVLQSQNVYLSDKINYMNQEVIFRNAVRNLNFLMGDEPGKEWHFTDIFEAKQEDYVLEDLKNKMLSNNRTLKNQYINLLIKQSEIKLKQSTNYPSVSVSAGMEDNWKNTNNEGTDAVVTNGVNNYANVILSYNI